MAAHGIQDLPNTAGLVVRANNAGYSNARPRPRRLNRLETCPSEASALGVRPTFALSFSRSHGRAPFVGRAGTARFHLRCHNLRQLSEEGRACIDVDQVDTGPVRCRRPRSEVFESPATLHKQGHAASFPVTWIN